jgi:NAD(P)-dependent dehydrogenase (short-subunit alcohol dehydrogenase family)
MSGQGVVITGGTRGLGLGLAEAFLQLGCSVAISGRNDTALEAAVTKLKATRPGAVAIGVRSDVSSYDDCKRLWDQATAALGRIGIWINNAGVGGAPVELAATPPDQIGPVVTANLIGTMNGARVALEGMRAQGGGQIVNVEGFGSSGMKRTGMSVYGATKYAVRYFTRSLVQEQKSGPVIISTLVPGLVVSDMLEEQYAVATPGRKKLYALASDLPLTIGLGVAPRILANQKNGAVISWIGPLQILGRLLSSKYKNRGLLGKGAATL